MTSLLVRELPWLIETRKDDDPSGVWVSGFGVVQAELARSLLQYGRYERYYFLLPAAGRAAGVESRLAEYPHSERASLISVDDLTAIAAHERLVLLTGSSAIERLLPLRQMHRRTAWPVTGFTHALSFRRYLPECLLLLLGELYEHDSLICTSVAGKRALQNIFDQLSHDLAPRLGQAVEFRGRLPVIPFGTDVASVRSGEGRACRGRLGISPDAVVFLSLGRFSADYKADLYPLILHFSELARAYEDVVLVLAGDDTEQALAPKFQACARSLAIAERVIVRPNLTQCEKAGLYDAADVFVSISDNVQETFGLTLIEAMAHGLPVVASDWSGYRETVQHGCTGLLVPTYWDASTVDSLTCDLLSEDKAHWLLSQCVCIDWRCFRQHLAALHDNPTLRRRLGENGRRRALERYDWPVVIRQYEDLWEEQLAAGASRIDASFEYSRGLHELDRRSIFSHYATELAGTVTMLRLTELGRRLVFDDSPLATAAADAMPFEGPLRRTMSAIADSDAIGEDGATIDMRTLVARLRRHLPIPADRISRNLVRLVKYGILERLAIGPSMPIADEPPIGVSGTRSS